MVSYTPILKLTQPDFDQVPWDEAINDDLSILDAAFGKFMVIPGFTGVWQNATHYQIGMMLVDSVDSSIWQCAVGHTSAAAPTTFAQDRAAHPTFWSSNSVPQNYVPVGGGTMTGPLTLSGTPTATNQAATKAYVDGAVGRAGGPFLPLTGGNITGEVNAAVGFTLSNSGARWYSDNAFTYFVQDGAGWYWRYTRGIGTLNYINGSGVNLFQIGADGSVVAQGNIAGADLDAAGNVIVSGHINAAGSISGSAFTHSIVSDFTITRVAPTRNIQFATDNYLTYSETNADLHWVIGSIPALGYTTANTTLTNFVGPMAGLTAYVVTSDARVKTDIEPATHGLAAVMALRPMLFKHRGRPRTEIGFIAQDVQEVLPEAVSEIIMSSSSDVGTVLGMSIDPIVAALVNAVKELQARIVVLEAK